MDPGYNVWIEWGPLSRCLPVVSMMLVKMFGGVRVPGTVRSKGASLIMVMITELVPFYVIRVRTYYYVLLS